MYSAVTKRPCITDLHEQGIVSDVLFGDSEQHKETPIGTLWASSGSVVASAPQLFCGVLLAAKLCHGLGNANSRHELYT